MKIEINEQLNKLEGAISDLECLRNDIDNISTIIYQEINNNNELNPLIDYINELEKDYYFRVRKEDLTVKKIVDDLIRLVKEIKE